MCMGGSTPSTPKPEPLPDPVPQNQMAEIAPPPLAPSPELVNAKEDAPKITKKSKRAQKQQAAKGTGALRIPLNTGAKASSATGLNIPS